MGVGQAGLMGRMEWRSCEPAPERQTKPMTTIRTETEQQVPGYLWHWSRAL